MIHRILQWWKSGVFGFFFLNIHLILVQICLGLNFAMSLAYCQPVNSGQTSLLMLRFAGELFRVGCGFGFLARGWGAKGEGGGGASAAIKHKFGTGSQTISLRLMPYFCGCVLASQTWESRKSHWNSTVVFSTGHWKEAVSKTGSCFYRANVFYSPVSLQ